MGQWVLCKEHARIYDGSGVARHAITHGASVGELNGGKVFIPLGTVSRRFPPPATLAQEEYALVKKAEAILGGKPVSVPRRGGFPYEYDCETEAKWWSSEDEVAYCILDYVRGKKVPCIGWENCPRRVYNPPHTRLVPHEELLMLTYGKYPEEFCPRTNLEEMRGIIVAQNEHARISIGRGWESPRDGHKAMLSSHGKYWMDTNRQERMSMMGASAWCPNGGRVFVGGLGLGLVLLYIAKRKPREVVVCELDESIIDLVWPRVEAWFGKRYSSLPMTIIHGDALEKVQDGPSYDWVFMDLWSEANYRDETVALIREAEAAAKQNLAKHGRVTCWMKKRILRQSNSKGALE